MADRGSITGRKGKKSKKKQTASMSEPIDLEAGERVDEFLASNIAKTSLVSVSETAVRLIADDSKKHDLTGANATATSELLRSDSVPEVSKLAMNKALPKTTKAPIPPPPKARPMTIDRKPATETIKDDAPIVPKASGLAEPDSSIADMADVRMEEKPNKKAPELVKAVNGTTHNIKATSKKTRKETTHLKPTLGSKVAEESAIPISKTIHGLWTGEVSINPSVLTCSFAPDLPKSGCDDVPSLPMDTSGPKLMRKPFKAHNQENQESDSPVEEPIGLPSFDHWKFSHISNIQRPTTNDHGPLLKVQTNKCTFVKIHRNVLRQSSKYLKNLCTPDYAKARVKPHTISWSSKLSFEGITSTYIYWLYKGTLPTTVTNVSDETKVDAVLLALAKEYVFGSKVLDTSYRNDIMDHFITIHVQTRTLTFSSVVDVVYKGTKEGSPMRRLLAEMHAFIVIDELRKLDLMDHQPKAFVKDVLKNVLVLRPNELDEWWWFLENRMYHQ